jgi:hypothetical protein
MLKRGKIFLISGLIFFLPFSTRMVKNTIVKVTPGSLPEEYNDRINWNDLQGVFAAGLINPSTSLIGKKIIMYPYNFLKLNISGIDFNFTPTEIKTIYNKYFQFKKQLNIFNPSQNIDTISITKDSSGIINFNLRYSQITDGPFSVFPGREKLDVRSHYSMMDVIPIKIIYSKQNVHIDEVEIKWEPDYPPYYISQYYRNKNFITRKDIIDILNSYSNLNGDYFDQNAKQLVCTDAVILIIKTIGVDYAGLLNKYNIKGNEYLQRNADVMYLLLKKLNLIDDFVHYFMGGDRNKIYNFGRYKNLTAENFGIAKLEPGQVMFYDRYFNSGPKTGEVQRFGIHSALITEVVNGKIAKAGMVTSRSHKPPFDTLIMLNSDVNFPAWFGYRQHYLGSDETHEDLRYLVYAIMDFKSVLQRLRAINVLN